jgi:hypothetical protein
MQAVVILRRAAAVGALASAAACAGRGVDPGPPRDAGPYAGTPEVLGDSMLRFARGAVYAPRVYGLEYLATMRDARGAPVLVLSGAECYACDAPRAVYFRAPDRALPPSHADTVAVYAYPGRVKDYENGKLVFLSTLFFGECLEGRAPVALQYATTFDGPAPTPSANVTELAADGFRDRHRVARPDSAAVLSRVAAGRCREVPPAEQFSGP